MSKDYNDIQQFLNELVGITIIKDTQNNKTIITSIADEYNDAGYYEYEGVWDMAYTHWITYRLPKGGSQKLPVITGDDCVTNAINTMKTLMPQMGKVTHHYCHQTLWLLWKLQLHISLTAGCYSPLLLEPLLYQMD